MTIFVVLCELVYRLTLLAGIWACAAALWGLTEVVQRVAEALEDREEEGTPPC